jgi:hypothetical protein
VFLVGLVVDGKSSAADRSKRGRCACDVDGARLAISQDRAGARVVDDREAGSDGDGVNFYLLVMSGGVGRGLGLRGAGLSDYDVAEREIAGGQLQRRLLFIVIGRRCCVVLRRLRQYRLHQRAHQEKYCEGKGRDRPHQRLEPHCNQSSSIKSDLVAMLANRVLDLARASPSEPKCQKYRDVRLQGEKLSRETSP